MRTHVTRTMYDGIDASRLPVDAQLVAGYVDGLYVWSTADWARFPNAVKVRIAVFSQTNDGEVLDVEPGNATPAESVDWVLRRREAGVDPTVYMNTSTWPTVREAFTARKVAEPHYWIAQYDGVAQLPAGAIAKQHTNDETAGWDVSVVADHWPGVDPAVSLTDDGDQMHQRVLYDATNAQQHFILLAGQTLYHRVYDEATGVMSHPMALPGPAVNPAAGVDAAIMMNGKQLHVFTEFIDTSRGTGAHYYLTIPVDPANADTWGIGVL